MVAKQPEDLLAFATSTSVQKQVLRSLCSHQDDNSVLSIRHRFGCQLTLEIHEVSAQQPPDALHAAREIGVRLRGYEISLAGDGELGFQTEELAFRGPVQLPLLRSGVSSISVSDGAGSSQRTEHELIGDHFRFAAGALFGAPDDLGAECDGFLPDLEVTDVGGHGIRWGRSREGAGPLHCIQ